MTVVKTHYVALDMYTPNSKKFRVVEGDTANIIQITLTDRGDPVDLTGCKVLVVFAKEGLPVEQDNEGNGVTITGEHHNVILVELNSTSYVTGENTAQVVITSGDAFDKQATSAWFNFDGERAIAGPGTMPSAPEWPLLSTALKELADIARGVQADYAKTDTQDPAYIKNKPVVGEDTQAATQTLEAATSAIADTAIIPTYNSGHVSITWAQIKSWLTSAFSAVFALLTHAARHATSGEDPITPNSIGALSFIEAQARTAAELDQMRINANIATPNYKYSEHEIPFTWAQIKNKVATGDFVGLRVGDYKDITLNGTFYDAAGATNKTITNNVFRMEIAGIDTYYQYGDTNVPHHIDFISRDCLGESLLCNATDTNSGGYIGSALFTTLNGANGLQKLLPADVVAVILNKRGLTEIKTAATASSWAWNDMGVLWLPTEREVWGQDVWSEHNFGGGLAMQYPIFKDGLRHVIKGNGNSGARCTWWCASSVAGSAALFCSVGDAGFPNIVSAITANVRVPLCFRIA